MSRIIKAFESDSESVCAFSFEEIVEAVDSSLPEATAPEAAAVEATPDRLADLESLIQQRLLEAELRAQ